MKPTGMKEILKRLLLVAACTLPAIARIQAQGGANYGPGLRIKFNEDGSKYLRTIFWGQIWARHTEQNPGTTINGDPAKNSLDIGARRLRFLAQAQISPRYLIVLHAGINNQSFVSGGAPGSTGTGAYGQGKKPPLFFHDVYNEYALIPAIHPKTLQPVKHSLYLGAGLHYWWGLSRMTSASTLNFLMTDAPVFNWPLIENSDQFARQYGMYIKGKLGKLQYQMHLNKPFATSQTPVLNGPAVDNNGDSKAALGGYYDLQLFEQENNTLPYRVGTYIGTKKVLNIGAGFYHNKDGTRSKSGDDITQKHNISLQALDVFADLPVGNKAKNMAITAYSVFYNYDFGPDYLRSVGILNTGSTDPAYSGTKALEGAGNNRFMMGTGNIWYTQAGWLLPKGRNGKIRVQPMAAYTLKNFEALNETGHYYDVGTNFFLDGHHSRMTLQFSNRPLYHPQSKKVMDRAGELILQFQVYL